MIKINIQEFKERVKKLVTTQLMLVNLILKILNQMGNVNVRFVAMNVVKKQGLRRRLNEEEYKKRCQEKYGDKYGR